MESFIFVQCNRTKNSKNGDFLLFRVIDANTINVKIYATSECNFTQSFRAIGQETNGLNPYGF